MNITLYWNFYKKENSTKQPAPGAGHLEESITVTGYLREPCSIMQPVVEFTPNPFTSNSFTNPSLLTYAYIATFNRYYFVTDWVWNNGVWACEMQVDVLATYKNNIGQSHQYVLRTASNTSDFNGAILDTMYPATTNFGIERLGLTNPFVNDVSQGCYIVGVISNDDVDAIGAVDYYAMDSNTFGDFKEILFSNVALEEMGITDNGVLAIPDMSEPIFRTMFNPYQYITSCMWFPVSVQDIYGDSVSAIPFGWWVMPASGKKLLETEGEYFELPRANEDGPAPHPQAATRGKYLNYAPYTRRTLYGKYGTMPVDVSMLEIGDYLIGCYTVDYITGACLYQLFKADNHAGNDRVEIGRKDFMIGVPIQIAQIGTDYLGAAATAINAGSSIISGAVAGMAAGGVPGAIAGGISSGVSGIKSTIEAAIWVSTPFFS